MGDERYGIDDLARLAGVSRRTVRYYVQEGLLPAPSGAGRGAHYGREHLDRILMVKSLQESGLTLDEVLESLERPRRPASHPVRHAYRREWSAHPDVHLPPAPADAEAGAAPPAVAPRSAWTRIELLPGVEIQVSGGRRLPSPGRLAELAEWCRTHFAPADPDER